MAKKPKAVLLGVGLDEKEGHKRFTKGNDFLVVGGTKETHEFLQEKAMEFSSEVKRRGKRMEEISKDEFMEITDRIGIYRKG